MACIFLIDRTFEGFLQKVVDSVVNVYDKYLEPDDLVGYYGLGEKWIFNVQEKGKNAKKLREQIVNSVEKAGDPHVYSSINKCIDCLSNEVDDKFSKWLVVLTDTADFECANEKGVFDKGYRDRAEKAVDGVVAKMKASRPQPQHNRQSVCFPSWLPKAQGPRPKTQVHSLLCAGRRGLEPRDHRRFGDRQLRREAQLVADVA